MKMLIGIGVLIALGAGYYVFTQINPDGYFSQQQQDAMNNESLDTMLTSLPHIIPIEHASLALEWDGSFIYADPTGDPARYAGVGAPSIVLITDVHGDHLSSSTIAAILGDASLIVPQAVKDLLPADLAARAKVMHNGDTISERGFVVRAMPMYNLPESDDAFHVKGRGNGYIIERGDMSVYIAGDTAGIPEMRALTGIDIAFVPMNLPFTMTVEEAADAVLAFKPLHVYPYHYRGREGLADVAKFKQLVNAGNPDIDVQLLNWYPAEMP